MIATSPRQFLRSVGFPGYRRRSSIEASYDAAMYSGVMEGAWVNADALSADQANSASVRQTLRSRSRYECLEANSFLRGAITTVVDCLIGRGPRLQMQFRQEQMPPGVNAAELNRKIEALFSRWSKASRYGEYLRTLVRARIVDGEGYGLRTTSRTIPWDLPQLFCRNIEAERFTSFFPTLTGELRVDGMRIDNAGEVVSYFVNKSTDDFYFQTTEEVPRSAVTHLYRRERPGQHHGVPELTTSLPLCNLLRQYTIATVTAARTAAKHAGLLQTQASAVTSEGVAMDDVAAFDREEVDYDMLTALPKGWQLVQMRAEQPTTTYEMFRDCLLGEIVRPLGAPLNIVLGSSAKWNYASTQADQVTFANRNRIERHEIEIEECDRTFAMWWQELRLIPGLIPDLGQIDDVPHCWFWDGLPDADPQTLASARQLNLQTGHSSREEELAKSGIDIDSHDGHAAKSLGLTVTEFRQTIARKLFDSATIDTVLSSSAGGAPVAMNGAQLQALTLVATNVSSGQMRPAMARSVVAAAFPALSQTQIAEMFPDELAATPPSVTEIPQQPLAEAAA